MPVYITPEIMKAVKAGEFLTPPDHAKSKERHGYTHKLWRETFEIVAVRTGETDEGGEYISVDLVIPSDVITTNQGRTAKFFLGFPPDESSKQFEISVQKMVSFFGAVGYTPVAQNGTGFRPVETDTAALTRMRFDAQVDVGEDKNGTLRQELNYFRAPK